jgi:hypothetical protein
MQHPSGGLVQKSTFARFLEFFDFRLFQQYRPVADIAFVSIKLSETAIHSVDENAATNNQDERERRKCL